MVKNKIVIKCELKPFADYPFTFRLFEKIEYCEINGSALFTYVWQMPTIVPGTWLVLNNY